jgi:hypothetical protein
VRSKKQASAGTVTIHRPAAMTEHGRHEVALWLRRTASMLERNGTLMAKKFTARYLYDK